jgi:predicted metal-dependent phosphoesterase TrpH
MATKRKTTGIQNRKGPTKRGAASASKSRAPATQRAKRASPAPAKRAPTPARPAVATTPVATQLPRDPKGKRAQFYQDPAIDQLWAVVAAITGEVSVAFDRLDTLERLLERDGGVTRDSIEAYRPDESAAAERARRREELIQRVFQVLSQYGR